ncbi:MAG: hypothetical protein ACPG51_19915 [Thiolinea sp.]
MKRTAQDALNAAHSQFSHTPEQRREYINANIHHLSTDELKELVTAMKASKAGDKGAIKRLVDRKGCELAELEKLMLNGRTPEELKEALTHDINDQESEA